VEVPIHEARWWAPGYSTGFWPGVLLSKRRADQLRRALRDRDQVTVHTPLWVGLLELVLHERRHVWQQAVATGVGFLVSYGVTMVVLMVPWVFRRPSRRRAIWFEGYWRVPWEADARSWAATRLARGDCYIRRP
jgi:hypothetical protein